MTPHQMVRGLSDLNATCARTSAVYSFPIRKKFYNV